LSFEVIGEETWRGYEDGEVEDGFGIPPILTKQMNNILVSWYVLDSLYIFREALATCHEHLYCSFGDLTLGIQSD